MATGRRAAMHAFFVLCDDYYRLQPFHFLLILSPNLNPALSRKMMVQTFDDDQLVQRLRSGDEDAFTEIYARYWKLLFYIAGKRLKNYPEAEEAVQNIFTDLWARRATLIINRSLKYYLAAAVQYQVMNFLSRQQDLLQVEGANESPSAMLADQHLRFQELEQQIQAIVSSLPEKCRLVYRMSREQGLNNREIATQLGIAEKTVENQLTKALSRLREGLDHSSLAVFILLFLND